MKKIFLGLLVLGLVGFSGLGVMAQKPTKARDLFIQKEKDEKKGKSGAKVRILLKRGTEEERYVAPTENFYAGDKIKLAFDINFSGYVALLNIGSSGKITMLYPYVGANSKVEPSDKEQLIPGNPRDWIVFDETPGTEQVTIVFSTNPIESIQQVINMSGQAEPTSAPPPNNTNTQVNVNNNGNGSTIYIATSEQAQAILQELNSRSLKRSKTRDLSVQSDNSATYVVVESSLISEPTAFVISLKHDKR